ncbi:MAG: hypothetical protein JWM89_1848 [Acidimicrobiales bacterium]|nr:hypothetical protein [Acidimicrobiales bacterium]
MSVTELLDLQTLVMDGLPGYFCLHYQPEFDLETDELTGCEALVRWWHPDFGMLQPGASLHDTKWAARLEGLEEWTFRAAFAQSAAWDAEGRSIKVAVNVSRGRLAAPGFLDQLHEIIEATGANPEHLGVDVPLSAFTREPVTTADNAVALADLGIAVIADGVLGDTAGPALARTPVSVLKIPLNTARRQRLGFHPLVASALALAHGLEIIGVAKAAETTEDVQVLQAMGFDRAFGIAFSPAVSAHRLDQLLSEATS